MRIGKLAHTLTKLYLNEQTRRRTVFLRGPSGIGKTEVIYQMSAVLKEHIQNWDGVRDIRLSQFDPVDFRGIPSIAEGRTVWNPPAFFPMPDTAGIIFLDEITSAPPAVQAVAYQLCNERRVGDYVLPEAWMVIAAGNRQSDRGVTFNLAAPLLNRMTIIDVDTTVDDWLEHAARCGKRPEVMAFVKARADLLHKFDNNKGQEQFPSPRGWFAVSDILDADLPPETRVELIKGAVGQEAGLSFESYLRIYERIPDLDAIAENPDAVPVPDDLDVRYCLAMGICARLTAQNFATYWAYIKRMPKELQTLIVKLAVKRDKGITQTAAFGEWAVNNAEAFRRV